MSWENRLKEASYTSANGNNIVFMYEDVSVEFDKKSTAFNFPDANGTYIQNSGNTSRRFPMRIFLSGVNYDLEATRFVNILSESGIGRLSHPMYGEFNAVPFGRISRVDALKTAGNQAIFELEFWQTIDLIYPLSQRDPASSVLNSVGLFTNQTSEQFKSLTDFTSASFLSNFRVKYNNALKIVTNTLRPIADFQNDTRSFFTTVERSINQGIDVLIKDPLTLAYQTIELIKTPSRALTDVKERLDAYSNLKDIFINQLFLDDTVSNKVINQNEFLNDDLFASSMIIGSVLSAVNNDFSNKTEALQTAELILSEFETVQSWRDTNFKELELIDTGESYQQLQETVALTVGFLVEISFTLKQENSLILDRPRTIIDLCAELYQNIDDNLDFFINSNNLTGSEILELPRGKEIVYYI